jgi:hypothetical protein
MVVAVFLVFGILFSRHWLVNRRRKARNERPPQPTKLLRPAGYSCFCRLYDAVDQLLFALLQAVAAGGIFGVSFAPIEPVLEGLIFRKFSFAQLRAFPNARMFFVIAGTETLVALVALIWCICAIRLFFKYEDDVRNWRLGARGEQAVAESLADPKLSAAGYRAFHDLSGDGQWNIDHVAVGPGGVFVIETKACVRRKATRDQPEHKVVYDGRMLRFPWRVEDRAVGQVESNAEWLRKKIAPYAPDDMVVHPVIVAPGWFVESLGNFPVRVMNATYLVNYLAGAERRFTPEQLRPINSRLDELCRTLEF